MRDVCRRLTEWAFSIIVTGMALGSTPLAAVRIIAMLIADALELACESSALAVDLSI